MSIKIKKHWAERFIDFYPVHTNLTLKGSYNADWRKHLELNNELFHQLAPFFKDMRAEIKEETLNEAISCIVPDGNPIAAIERIEKLKKQNREGA